VVLELWTIAPTPAKAHQLGKSTVERLLKQHRIRRVDAETVVGRLREPAIKVADGVVTVASIHIRSLVARLKCHTRYASAATRTAVLCAGVADRLLGLACVLLQRQTPFDPHFARSAP
jgi:hypothetical protein